MARGSNAEGMVGLSESRFSSIFQGQQRLQVDQTVRTVEGIFLRSVRSTCGNCLRYICHLVRLLCLKLMCNSFSNSISPFFKSQRFEFQSISLRIQQCLKALFANWLYKILKIKSVTVANNYLILCAQQPGLLGFWGKRSMKHEKNLTQ